MSEFPKSFHFCDAPDDVITFHSADEIAVCRSGFRWDYALVRKSHRWIPFDASNELTLLRTFRDTVIQATQDTPNHRLPQVIFAADDVVRKVNQQQESIT